MPFVYPQDHENLKKERKSYQSLFNKLNMDVWVPNGSDKTDHGMDYGFEFIEDNQFKGYRIFSQIKSTAQINKNEEHICFDLKVTTAAYAISSAQPFVLFVVDLIDDTAYYTCLQDFFIENPERMLAVDNNRETIRIKLPIQNVVTREDTGLQEIAKAQYSFTNGVLIKTR